MAPNEAAIAAAIADIQSKRLPSLRAAAAAYKIPRSTLTNRLNAATRPRSIAAQERQLLPPEQEERLVNWVLQREACGHAIGRAQLHEMVLFLVQVTGVATSIGHHWIERFMSRHPAISMKIGKKLDIARYEGTSYEIISPWFDALKTMIRTYNVHATDISNMDETGLALGVSNNSKVIGFSESRVSYTKSPENREWVSIIECITTTGRALTPLVIFKGQSLQTTWFSDNNLPNWLFASSGKGWTSNPIGLQWLKQVYLPSTSPPRGRYRLLLIDGHGSHADVEFMSVCYQNNVLAFYLPPHSSHVLQPLDLTCFGPLKGAYRKQLRTVAELDDAAPVKKQRFISLYQTARTAALTETNIKSGFAKMGLVPWSPTNVLRGLHHQEQSSRAPGPSSASPDRPIKPPSTATIYTPKNKQDFKDVSNLLASQTPSRRSIRTLVNKTTKLIDRYSYQFAELQAENKRTAAQLEALQPRKRVRVAVDSNTLFADVAMIATAKAKAASLQAEWDKTKPNRQARELSERLTRARMTDFMSEWHVLRPHETTVPSTLERGGSGGVANSVGGQLNGV
jgi:hypothetical protein